MGSKYKIEHGDCLRFSFREDRVRMFLTPEGRERIAELRERDASGTMSDLSIFQELLEDFIGNGWTEVRPEAIGDLRDDAWLVITNDYTYADPENDDNIIVGVAYSYHQYAVESYITPLTTKGYIDFWKHEYLTPLDFDYAVANARLDLFLDSENERLEILRRGDWRQAFAEAEYFGQAALPL
jgi:hypothetical protein